MKLQVLDLLKRYSGKSNICLTQRGNKSIYLALKIAKSLGFDKLLIPDQGGWITYPQYAEKLKFNFSKIKTENGLISADHLSGKLDDKTCLLVNSLPGYYAEQPMGLISAMCKQKNSFLINDCSGSIGTEIAKYGDIILGSFGENKPIDLEYGGFIAWDILNFNKEILDATVFEQEKLGKLYDKLSMLSKRVRYLRDKQEKIKKELTEFSIIHPEKNGINVIVKYGDDHEKERIINYCRKHNYEFTECPRDIRVNTDAISIEVKRLKGYGDKK